MIYQLPNGKVIYVSVEEFLSLTDDELSIIVNNSPGEHVSQEMFYGSHSFKVEHEDFYEIDLDFECDSDIPPTDIVIDLNNIPEDMP